MIKQSGPDKITVAKLVEKCQISRSLFYYYFNDIFDVMIYHLENDLNQAINASLKVNSPKDSWFIVGTAKTDTRDQRRKVLEQLIDTGLMTKAGIMSHIEWLISIRKNMPSMRFACREWEDDLEFISRYEMKNQRVIWGSIVRKREK